MDKVADTITGVLVWAAVLEWAERSHQTEWRRLLQTAQGKEIGDTFALQMDPPAMFAAQTYLIGMALDHMAERLQWLQGQRALTDKAASAVTEFLTLYRSEELKNLRDVLAHAHDYDQSSRLMSVATASGSTELQVMPYSPRLTDHPLH